MKFGIENLLNDVTVTFSSNAIPYPGGEEENMLNNDSQMLCMFDEATVTILLQFEALTVDMIGLFNVQFGETLTIRTYSTYPTTITNTKTITPSDLTGLFVKNTYLNLTNKAPITAIELIFTGEDEQYEYDIDTWIGYIWAGLMIDLDCAENLMPIDQSEDEAKITRVNHPDNNNRYEYQEFKATVKKENNFVDLRNNMRHILNTGYGTPRPWYFDEPFFPSPEIILGILNSGKVPYDLLETDGGFIAQTSFGIREVF